MIAIMANIFSLLSKAFNQFRQHSQMQLSDRVNKATTYFINVTHYSLAACRCMVAQTQSLMEIALRYVANVTVNSSHCPGIALSLQPTSWLHCLLLLNILDVVT